MLALGDTSGTTVLFLYFIRSKYTVRKNNPRVGVMSSSSAAKSVLSLARPNVYIRTHRCTGVWRNRNEGKWR